MRKALFLALRRVRELLAGKGLGRIPFVKNTHDFLFQQLMPKRGVVSIKVQSNIMYVNSEDQGLIEGLLKFGVHEKETTQLFRSLVRSGMVVVDIGAHIGYYTLIAAEFVGKDGKVFAFEPAPNNYRLLVRNIDVNGYKNVIPIQKAVSNNSGRVELFLNPEYSGRHSLMESVVPNPAGSVFVDAITLDEFFAASKLNKVDIVKVDVEGADMLVLEGMSTLIRKNNELKILLEFWAPGLKKFGCDPLQLLNKMKDSGFHFKVIDEKKGCIQPMDIGQIIRSYDQTNLLLEKALSRG